MDKAEEYAVKLANQVLEMFDEDSENYIDRDELGNGKNATHFIHALANLMPNMITTKLTGCQNNALEFNHMANQLVFQYSKLSETEQEPFNK